MYFQSGLILFLYFVSTAVYNIIFLFPSGGGWSNFSSGFIKPNARLVAHEIKILPSLLTTKNGISSIHLLSGCITYKLQDPMIFTFLLVCVPKHKSLGAILVQSGSLNRYLYMLTAILFTSTHVSFLAHRNLDSFLCGLTLSSKLVNRCFGIRYFSLACLACTFICKQNDSSLLELSLEFLYIESSSADSLPLVNQYAFGDLGLFMNDSCFFVTQATKMTKPVTVSTLIFSSRTFESFYDF